MDWSHVATAAVPAFAALVLVGIAWIGRVPEVRDGAIRLCYPWVMKVFAWFAALLFFAASGGILWQALQDDPDPRAVRLAWIGVPLMTVLGLPYPTVIGKVEGGEWASTVLDRVVAEGRYGVRLGQTWHDAAADLRACISAAAAADPFLREHPPDLALTGGKFSSARVPADDPLPVSLAAAAEATLGRRPALLGKPYGADMRLLVVLVAASRRATASGLAEHHAAALVIHPYCILGRKIAGKDFARQRVLDLGLDGALQGSRTVDRVEACIGDLTQRRVGHVQLHVHGRQPFFQILHLDIGNRLHMRLT